MVEDYEAKRQSELNESLITRVDFTDHLKTFLRTSSSFRREVKEDKEALIKARDHIKSDIQNKLDLEKNIYDFIKFANAGGNIDANQMLSAISLYKEAKALLDGESNPGNVMRDTAISFNQGQGQIQGQVQTHTTSGNIKILNKKLFAVLSSKKEESLRNDLKKLTVKDKPAVLKHLEEIKAFKWNITEEVMKKLHELAK